MEILVLLLSLGMAVIDYLHIIIYVILLLLLLLWILLYACYMVTQSGNCVRRITILTRSYINEAGPLIQMQPES